MEQKKYPQFQALDERMKEFFDEAFLKTRPVISEFTFTNLYCWRNFYKFSVCMLENFIVLRSQKEGKMQFFPPIGIGEIRPVIQRIISDTRMPFIRLPEELAGIFSKNSSFKAELDRDNSDYLYKIEDLKLLKGKKYDAKRNLIKKFNSAYKYEYMKLDASNASECLDFEERWCLVKDCDNVEGLSQERQAIREMLSNFGNFNLIGAAIKIKKSICAVAIAQMLNPNTLVMHVLKADPNMQGLYQVMLNDFLRNDSGNFEYINFEQDLGVPGLRSAKLSYHPFKIINKYTVSFV
ncbi:MAG: phosphatidylglycerol lysyltransferase domain-containing protein [Candidatus Omnitrophica bacterium]|jgi:hypothetical protein|nr:phosphatidylglycerol lysyltransferase domain-containing protein [Candidatus Omnitrophota bacterium]